MPTQGTATQAAPAFTGRLTEVALGYQNVLALNPRHAQALVGMCLVALASRQIEAAVSMARAAVDAAPEFGMAWVALGQAHKAARQFEEAEKAYEQAIRLDGMNELARLGLGELKLNLGRPEEAVIDFKLALCRQPALVAAHLGLANALAVSGRFDEALARYEETLALRPRLPEAEFAAGFVLARLGRLEEAEIRYRRALVERPDFAAAWMNLGSLLREQGRDAYAEAALLRAVELRPDMIAGWISLAMLHRDLHQPAEAAAHLRTALALNPNQVETHIAWCQLHASQSDLAEAWVSLRQALAIDPDQPEAVNMQGILLHSESLHGQAVAAFERAEKLGHRAAASNRGNTLLDMGNMAEALRAHEHAVLLDPDHPGAQYNLALTHLRLGDWEHGWAEYEARWHFREVHRRPRVFQQPRWTGESLDGQRILLHAEQGLGDSIQFCRYATLVAARGGIPILQVQQPVGRLLRSLAVVRAGLGEVALLGAETSQFDLECPLMSLPGVFETTTDTVPWAGAYLGADAEQASDWRPMNRSRRTGSRTLRVGLAWAGNPGYKADSHRSMDLQSLVPLLRMREVTWISLQKGIAAAQLSGLPDDVHLLNSSGDDRDLADTAALIASLDLVITTDTCIAHLAGAMAKPVWILLPYLSDWRWMQEVQRTPWYPTARLLRQSSPGDWQAVLNRAAKDLLALARSPQAALASADR